MAGTVGRDSTAGTFRQRYGSSPPRATHPCYEGLPGSGPLGDCPLAVPPQVGSERFGTKPTLSASTGYHRRFGAIEKTLSLPFQRSFDLLPLRFQGLDQSLRSLMGVAVGKGFALVPCHQFAEIQGTEVDVPGN